MSSSTDRARRGLQIIEFAYDGHHLAATLDDDFNHDTLGMSILVAHKTEVPALTLESLRLVDRIMAAYEGVMVDHVVAHAELDFDEDTRSRWAVEASIDLRGRRINREVERQLHVEGNVTAAEASLDFVARMHATPIELLRAKYF